MTTADFRIISAGALFSALAIALGAFGAHALAGQLTPDGLETWRTASHYLGLQGLGLVLTGLLPQALPRREVALLCGAGAALFSASLYILSLSGWRSVAWLTPVGGVAMLAGWLRLAVSALVYSRRIRADAGKD